MSLTPNLFGLIADYDGDMRQLLDIHQDGPLPVLPLRNMVLFPGIVAPISIGRESSRALVSWMQENNPDGWIVVSTQVDSRVEVPLRCDLFDLGTLARIVKVLELPDGTMNVIVQAYGRVMLAEEPLSEEPFMRIEVEHVQDFLPDETSGTWKALYDSFRNAVKKYLHANQEISREAAFAIENVENPCFFVNLVATNLPISIEDKIELLSEDRMTERTYELLASIRRELRYIELRNRIEEKTSQDLDKQQREYFLQQEMRNIQQELSGNGNPDVVALNKKAEALILPKAVKEIIEREIVKLERQNPASPDYNLILTYLETIVSLPWGKSSEDNLSISRARRTLDRDHYGMKKVKERILEHLAVMRVGRERRAPILCLYGPPGVGKTSLARSIAESLGRQYARISLGGLHDESEIRGHRRTYIGAMCGRVMKQLVKCGTTNPVFVLDEIDKVGGQSHNGDPQSALLELLDPEQNMAFHDNYLDFDFDLSGVFFIATANSTAGIPSALLDRMELIPVEGYLTEEKREIVKRHLLPKATAGLSLSAPLRLTSQATTLIIERYTRESGVRALKQMIDKLVRRVALAMTDGDTEKGAHPLRPVDVESLLGTPPYSRDQWSAATRQAGVATGLAWTAVGGEILFIETSVSPAKSPKLTTTGNLGEVMKESATLALEYVRAHASERGIASDILDTHSIHIHVPEGATPKDGPSAGITIATSIVSALTGHPVRQRLAMTGEITLRGRVLPVGGIKEKILAARRAGITDIVLSEDNRKDILDIEPKYVEGLTFHYVTTVAEVWEFAL